MEQESDTKQQGQMPLLIPTATLPESNDLHSNKKKSQDQLVFSGESQPKNFLGMLGYFFKQLSKLFPGNKTLRVITSIICLLSTGGVGYVLPHPNSASNSNSKQIVDFGYISFGVIHDVTIIDVYDRPITVADGSLVTMNFCDAQYIENGEQTPETFKDVDEPSKAASVFPAGIYKQTKNNSSDVRRDCQIYAQNSGTPHAGKAVTLVVSGNRNPVTSSFRNILRLIPQDT